MWGSFDFVNASLRETFTALGMTEACEFRDSSRSLLLLFRFPSYKGGYQFDVLVSNFW
jgi:hypothetical protein